MKQKSKYPTWNILIYYPLVASLIGAVILALFYQFYFEDVLNDVPMILLVTTFAMEFFVVFFMIAIFICRKRIYIEKQNSYILIWWLSVIVYLIVILILNVIYKIIGYLTELKLIELLVSTACFASVSTLTLMLFLPKTEQYLKEKNRKIQQRQRKQLELEIRNKKQFSKVFVDKIQGYLVIFKEKFLNPNTFEGNNYPHSQVVLSYLFLGGAVGGTIVAIFSVVLILVIYLAIIVGIMIGTIPSVLAGAYLSYKKVCLIERKDYYYVFIVGFFATFLSLLPEFIKSSVNHSLQNRSDFWDIPLYILSIILVDSILSLVGGLSAIIVARVCLPKRRNIGFK